MKNILDAIPNSLKDEVHSHVQAILEALDEDKAPKAMSILEAGFCHDAAVLLLPKKYRKRLRTTSSIKKLNEEIRGREQVIRISPNRESVISLLGSTLMGKDAERTTGKKYFDMEEYSAWRESEIPGQIHKVTKIF